MVMNDEADQGGDDENDVTPAAVGESAEAEGEHHDGAFNFGPRGGAGPVRPPPVAEEIPVDVGSVPHRHGDAEAHKEEVDEDDPDAGIEFDVYEGSSIKRKVGVLKKDANSIAHLLTHRYRNPFCESCVKAKMRHFTYPVGKDGFRLMKTSRPPEFTPEEWKMMSKYYTKEEKAEVKGGGKKKEEDPKSKESEISAPAEARTLQMPGGKRIRAMLRNRWGGVEWQYNWGLRKNISKIKNPMDGKHLAELEWVRIVVNPVDGAVVLMDSKQSQDVLRRNVQLEKEFECLVVIYAWKFKSEERSKSTPNWTKAVASVMESHKDEAETASGTDPSVDESTDLTWYEWEESAEVVSGKVPLAMPAIGEDGEARKYPSMPCVTSERIQHREKAAKVVRFFDALVSRPVGRKEMLTNPDALASMKKEWSGLIDQGVFDLGAVREYDAVAKEAKAKGEEIHMARAHGICVEKRSQLPVGDPKRKFKGRGVLLGNQVKNQSFEAAMFQDLGNSPASFEASRWADFLGCHDQSANTHVSICVHH